MKTTDQEIEYSDGTRHTARQVASLIGPICKNGFTVIRSHGKLFAQDAKTHQIVSVAIEKRNVLSAARELADKVEFRGKTDRERALAVRLRDASRHRETKRQGQH